jgi:hypothetical protein
MRAAALPSPACLVAGMALVLSAVVGTLLRMSPTALMSSSATRLIDSETVGELTIVEDRVRLAAMPSRLPALLEVHAVPSSVTAPRFRRNYVWGDSPPNSEVTSPSVIYSERAPPLPSSPQHIVDSPIFAKAASDIRQYTRIQSPYNVDHFENLLADHPNQPFVRSVVNGLRNGFSHFDETDWLSRSKPFEGNYTSSPDDLSAIHDYRDKEVAAGRWTKIPHLSEGMVVSPLFVVWQGSGVSLKARVVVDHTGSGINDGIPRDAARVSYDDMYDFGNSMREVRTLYPDKTLILYKADVKGAFPTLPADSLWQTQQIVCVDSATYYASLGLSSEIIQALGRWSSSAWKIYIREHPAIRAEMELASLHHHR